MNTSTKRNIVINGVSNLFAKTVRIADQLLLVPFFLSTWGAAYYGEWLTLTIFPSILAFSEMGFGTSTCNAFVLEYSGGNLQKASNIYKTGLHLISYTLILALLLCAILLSVMYYSELLNKSLISPTDAIIAVTLLTGSRLTSFYNQMYEGFYRSKRRAATFINLLTIGGFLRIGISILILTLGYGIIAFSLANFLVAILYNYGIARVGLKIIGILPKGSFDKSEAKKICFKGLGYMASPIWQAIYFQGSSLVVRILLGPESIATFNTVRTLCRSINQLYGVFNASVLPELQLAVGTKNMQKARTIFLRSIQLTIVVAVVGVFVLVIVGQPLYSWWTNNQLNVPNSMWYILMAGILVNATWWSVEVVFRALNKPYRFAVFGLISSIVSVAVSYLLTSFWGLIGASVSYVMFDVIMMLLVVPCAFSLFGMKVKSILNYS